MSTIAMTTLYPRVMPELPKCPKPLILSVIQETLIDFCHETQAWTHDLPTMNILADVANYRLDGLQPSYATIDRLLNVVLDGVTQDPAVDYTMASRDMDIEFVRTPSAAITAGLDIQVALRPNRTTELIERRLYEDWEKYWSRGVMSTLMLMPGKSWSDQVMGRRYQREYKDGIARARIQQNRGGTNRRMVARAPKPFRW